MTATPEEIRALYREDLGEVPPSVECGLSVIPEAIAHYVSLRRYLDGLADGDGLPRPYASLVFALLDVAERNYDGALNHSRAALNHGLTWTELMHGYVQTWVVKGFATSWGTVGWRVVEQLRAEGFGPADG
jgi:hypothetical protein